MEEPNTYEVRLTVTSALSADELEDAIFRMLDGNDMIVGSWEIEEE